MIRLAIICSIVMVFIMFNIFSGSTAWGGNSTAPKANGSWGGVYVEEFGAKGDGVSDDAPAIQKAIQAAGRNTSVILTGGKTYAIKTQIIIPSVKHIILEGRGGAPIIKWIGSTLDPAKHDDASGAMIRFVGNDHAWSGIRNLFLDADSKAVHCVYLAGYVNAGFIYERIHHMHPVLDGLKYDVSGTSGPVQFNIINCTAFPAIIINGKKAVAGRSVFHFIINSAIGQVRINGGSFDNGGNAGLILWETRDYGDSDVIIEGVHWESWMSDTDFIITKHSKKTTLGTISIVRCKFHVSQGQRFNALVKNISKINARMGLQVQNFRTRDAFNFLYEDVYRPDHNVRYSLKYLSRSFTLNIPDGLQPVIIP